MDFHSIKRFFTSSFVLHMEREIEALRGQNNMLIHALTVPPTTPSPRAFPKFTPAKTSWESYLAEQMALQEKEDTNGISGIGRV